MRKLFPSMVRAFGLAFLALLLTTGAVVAQADEVPPSSPTQLGAMPPAPAPPAEVAAENAVSFAGVKIFIDPETGRMRAPTDAERAELAAAMRSVFVPRLKSGAQHTIVNHEDGSLDFAKAVVGPEHLRFLTVTKAADGSLDMHCVDGVDNAVDAVLLETETADEER